MASATGLYDLRTKTWHEQLCEACRIEPARAGVIREISCFGRTTFRELGNAQLFNAIGDGAAGNLGSGAHAPGRIAINIGTSAAVRLLETFRRPLPFGLFRHAVDGKRTIVGGAVSNAGNLISGVCVNCA
jgi:Sugar (pentulose and hexulose) kinases